MSKKRKNLLETSLSHKIRMDKYWDDKFSLFIANPESISVDLLVSAMDMTNSADMIYFEEFYNDALRKINCIPLPVHENKSKNER